MEKCSETLLFFFLSCFSAMIRILPPFCQKYSGEWYCVVSGNTNFGKLINHNNLSKVVAGNIFVDNLKSKDWDFVAKNCVKDDFLWWHKVAKPGRLFRKQFVQRCWSNVARMEENLEQLSGQVCHMQERKVDSVSSRCLSVHCFELRHRLSALKR